MKRLVFLVVVVILLLILALAASACTLATPAPRATDTPAPVATATSTATPTVTPSPIPAPTREGTIIPPDAVVLQPGDPLQARIDAAPRGTTFAFAPGVYRRAHIRPRTGDVYEGLGAAVLDGESATYFAFQALDEPNDPDRPRDVTVRGFEIRGYVSHTSAESSRSPEGAIDGAEGWIIEGNHIHHNKAGVSLGRGNWGWGDGATVRGNRITDNAEIGVEINGSRIFFEGNELARNGYGLSNKAADWMGAASKFTDQPVWADATFKAFVRVERGADDQLVVRGNHSYHNNGMGLWFDVFNHNALVENNLVELNRSAGIFDELSTGTTIRANTVRWNRAGNTTTGLWGLGEIAAANSAAGLITGNTITVSPNGRGVVLVDESYRTPRMAGYRVVDNDITYEGLPTYGANVYAPIAGISGGGGNAPFRTAGNVFDGNRYTIPAGADPSALWFYLDGGLSLSAFRAAGHEARGVVTSGALRSPPALSFVSLGEENEGNMDMQTFQQVVQIAAFVLVIVVVIVASRASGQVVQQLTEVVKQGKDNAVLVEAIKGLSESFPPGTMDVIKQILTAGQIATDDIADALLEEVKGLIDAALNARLGTPAEAKVEAAEVKAETVAAANAGPGNYQIAPLPGTDG